jgi:hypothetical protein
VDKHPRLKAEFGPTITASKKSDRAATGIGKMCVQPGQISDKSVTKFNHEFYITRGSEVAPLPDPTQDFERLPTPHQNVECEKEKKRKQNKRRENA